MGGWAKFLMGLNLLLLSAVVAVFGYDAWLAREEREQLTQERVGEMIAQGVETRLQAYANEAAGQRESSPAARPISNAELRETIKTSIEAALKDRPMAEPSQAAEPGRAAEPKPAAEPNAQALQAASRFSIELGARTQELLERLTDQAQSLAKAKPDASVQEIAATAAATNASPVAPASVNGSPVAPPQAELSDAALMARVIEGINAAPPTAALPVASSDQQTDAVAPLEPGKSRRLAEVHFSPSSTDLSPGALRKTREAVDELKLLDVRKIRVIGFTDTIGSSDQNKRLARERAQNVAKMLAELGVPTERIEVVGRGEHGGPESTLDNVDEPLNRCVGIIAVN